MAYHTVLKDWMNDLPLAEELGYVNNLCIALAVFFFARDAPPPG